MDQPEQKRREKRGGVVKWVLIGHKARQGKDTFASMLAEELGDLGVRAVVWHFADAIKDIAADALGISLAELEERKNNYVDDRAILQRFGAGKMKEYFGESVWRDLLLERRRKYMVQCETLGVAMPEVVIVPDFRFPAEYIEGAMTVRVTRDGVGAGDHVSETAMDDYDYQYDFYNSGTLEELRENVKVFARDVKAWAVDLPNSLSNELTEIMDQYRIDRDEIKAADAVAESIAKTRADRKLDLSEFELRGSGAKTGGGINKDSLSLCRVDSDQVVELADHGFILVRCYDKSFSNISKDVPVMMKKEFPGCDVYLWIRKVAKNKMMVSINTGNMALPSEIYKMVHEHWTIKGLKHDLKRLLNRFLRGDDHGHH